MFYRYATAALVAVLPASMAFAVPATDEGAARIKTAIETYVSATPGLVTVTPAGESYDLTLDSAPLVKRLNSAMLSSGGAPDEQVSFSFSPIKYQLVDNGDGTWKVSTDQEVTYKFAFINMEQTASFHQKSNGIFDESFMGMRADEAVMSNYEVTTRQLMPEGLNFDAEPDTPGAEPKMFSTESQRIERMEYSITGQPNSAGGADYKGTYSTTGMTQKAVYDPSSFMQFMNYDLQIPVQEGTFEVKGLRNVEILGLLGLLIANPGEEALKLKQEELRKALDTALPVWDDISLQIKTHDIKVNSTIGTFGIKEVGLDLGLSGVSEKGRFAEAIRLSGLTIPPGIAPAWSEPLIPSDVNLSFNVSDFDLLNPARMIVAGLDLNDDDPRLAKLDENALLAALLPKGGFNISVGDGLLKGKEYSITYGGEMTITPDDNAPRGKALITATGLDKIEEALVAGPQETVGQSLMMLRLMRGMARPGSAEGEQVWNIDATSDDGVIKVNDMPVTQANP